MCGCGKAKTGGVAKFQHVGTDGRVIKTYSSETDARMAAASKPGTRVRPA